MVDRVLVTGGTGKTGSLVAQGLRDHGTAVKIATRRVLEADQVRFDWSDPTTFAPALEGVSSVYLVAPIDRSDHLAAMQPFLDQAVVDADRRLVLLSAASLPEGGPMMGAVQAWLRGHAAHWVSLRPSWFMQNFTTQHLPSILADGCIYSATADGRVGFIDAADIAAVAVAGLIGDMPNGEMILTGPEALSYDDIAFTITQVSGRPVGHCRLTTNALAARHRANGLPNDYADLLATMDERIAEGADDRTTGTVARITGRDPRAFADFVVSHARSFTAP